MGKRFKDTAESDVAFRTIEQSNATLVLGKGGVGKTMLIHELEERNSHLNMVIAAPTGIAALQAGGVTIHSLFKLPYDIIAPQELLHRDPPRLLQVLDMLVVDEASMVRADTFEAMDFSLRRAKNKLNEPFGGVKIVLVGDLCQLPPVVKEADKPVLARLGYEWPHFFTTKSYWDAHFTCVELTQPFRQRSEKFIRLLDWIRLEQNVDEATSIINRHCFTRDNRDPLMTLVTTNRMADEINARRMDAIPNPPCVYDGTFDGKLQTGGDRLPVPMRLLLKERAAVMLTKNDPAHNFVNGSLGVIQELGNDLIHVKLTTGNPGQVVEVRRAEWQFAAYDMDATGTGVKKRGAGTYKQFPVIPAWAVTIHKSQGQTLERVHIDTGNGAFAAGQIYVALSRCRSLNGITLARPIEVNDVVCDPVVKVFLRAIRRHGLMVAVDSRTAA